MRWREALHPVTMERIALMSPQARVRDLLAAVADEGTVELDVEVSDTDAVTRPTPASAALQRFGGSPASAVLARRPPDIGACEREGRFELLAGEVQLEQRAARALGRGRVSALVGWTPTDDLAALAVRVASADAVVVPLPRPHGVEPPTLLPRQGASRDFAPLVDTYATVPYVDLNPSVIAGLAYVLMFGMMFADTGEGALLLCFAFALRAGRPSRMSGLRSAWPFLAGAGGASMVFGALYGEFFGPTGLIPVLWLAPLDHPVMLLVVAVGVGAVLLMTAYALGTVNRFREGGWRIALYAPTGIAGVTIFLGLGLLVGAVYFDVGLLVVAAGVLTAVGMALAFTGLLLAAGGGAAGAAQATIELFDLGIRIGSNLVSFARLAAFGLTHAALGLVIWQATNALWHRGLGGAVAGGVVFVAGTAIAFGLEGLVAAIQALRLEYYELFSRIFEGEGRPFRPWHIPFDPTEAP